MRIISGIYKGRQFMGSIPNGVRPTADAVRESIFNILTNRIDFDGVWALDLFAGAGGMGIEALSRGAGFCCFVERNRKVCSYLEEIFTQFRIPGENYKLVNADAFSFLNTATDRIGSFDLVFADPPYKMFEGGKLLRLLLENSVLNENGILVTEHADSERIDPPDELEIISEKKFGSTRIEILRLNKNI